MGTTWAAAIDPPTTGTAGAPAGGHRAGRRTVRVAPVVLVGVLVALPLASAAVVGAEAVDGVVARLHLFSYVVALAFAGAAILIGRHQPANRLGPLATAIAWAFGLSIVGERYAHLGHERGWPAVEWVLWFAQWAFVPALWSIPTLVTLLFPDGRLGDRPARTLAAVATATTAVATVAWTMAPYGRVDGAPDVPVANPVAVEGAVGVVAAAGAVWGLAVVGAMAHLGRRVARSAGAERAQLSWLLLGLAGAVVSIVAGGATGEEAIPSIGIALLPAGLAVGVLRHRLWDVRPVVQRSLVYGLLLAAIVVAYGACTLLLGGVLGREVGAPLVATAVVALAVQPLRDRLQHLVGHLLYGEREDPYAAVSRLGDQLDAVADRGRLLVSVTDALVRTMRLRGAAVTVGEDVLAAVGELGPAPRAVPLTVAGEPVGTLLVGVAEGDDLAPGHLDLLAALARHVASVVQAERLQVELAASRARLVSAREEERRRIRRDLHDELGPTLAAIANEVERAGLDVEADPDAATARLDAVADRVRATVRDVRALVEGLRPAALDQLGLAGAVRELVRRLGGGPLAVTVTVDGELEGLPAAVEVGAYRIVGEALTNVVRHSGAGTAAVVLRRVDDRLEVTVVDDGCGLVPDAPTGVGRRSMAERAAELGGSLVVEDRAGGGVEVRAVLPVVEPGHVEP